ncbi:putative MATH and UCH domain protein [Aspergillus clavatus NRRL 1]|uniref:deoxyhypusine synthase n=1 Tax=Aspergillus clavatus (strain ATCC 1007 / CBS 513.65 / DSM 816 / NCTC 3887 / NRRL 1 / QM 1276 / 107) TaxID=344612 RepID=A1C5H6_ASPCL|nr:MATH and UCH domain protein, putative [Aspergillus clavatus NRRL 1]EAW14944.1 MATH and UCH domain protein, putaitve [Aspergillus clavatus NRRL 1]
MDTRIDTSVTVEQLPPSITLSVDSPPTETLSAPRVTISTLGDLPMMPPTDNQPADLPSEPSSQNDDQQPPVTVSDPTPPQPPHPELEHAYWAEIEEDTSVPDEEEMKEIESTADGDYSAYEYDYWEKNFHPDLEDPEYKPVEKARLTWKVRGVRGTKDCPNRNKIMRSPPAYIGGYWWTIKFFPRGNNVGSLSIYLECSPTMPQPDKTLPDTEFKVVRGPADAVLNNDLPEVDMKLARTEDSDRWLENFKQQYPAAAKTADEGNGTWRVSAQIGVILYNPDEPRTGWMQSSCHQFNPHNLDWGWTNFHGPWDQIHRRQRGQRQALLRNDTLAFDAYIRIIDDPTRSLWWHASDSEPTWDSLGLTGYRPLGDSVINHSAEVAGLASWLHIAPFCKIIQEAQVLGHLSNCDVKPKPLCDALQKFLWRLRSRSQSLQYVDTDDITSTLRNLQEYSGDVCEFWERLRRTIEYELADTDAPTELAKLFDSPVLDAPAADAVNTIPTDFNSRICVPADQAKTMREALGWYLDQKSGCWVLPPILHVELSRHRLDKAARQWRLIYNRVELDEELDLTPHLVDGQCGHYVLYGYIVHRGRRTSGKFFSILRPGGPGTRWLAFDDGSDNRVECLTRKTALGPHLGLDESAKVDHKTGHDVAIAVMYIRSDVAKDFLPGPQGPWDVSPALKEYYETGVHPLPKSSEGRAPATEIQVEVYAPPEYEQLPSLFDSYDLMSQAKSANRVLYMTVPRYESFVELRKKIALWASAGSEKPASPENIRLWQLGHTLDRFGPTLAFDRVSDLATTLDIPTQTVRLWMQVVADALDEAKYFAMRDPREAVVSENKPEEAIVERAGSESSDDHPPVSEARNGEAEASSSGNVTERDLSIGETSSAEPSQPQTGEDETPTDSPSEPALGAETTDVATTNAENDAVIAAIIAEDFQQAENESPEGSQETPSPSGSASEVPTENRAPSPAPEAVPVTPEEPEIPLPVEHVYYFIQIFDVEAQALRTVGSFFSRKEEKVKAALRKHLKWPLMKDFAIWQRVDGSTVTTMSSVATFDTYVPDGTCFIVGDKLNKDRRTELSVAGLFSNPDRLINYLSAAERKHPLRAFTGTKTIDASFTSEYYSGEFMKGYYHGKGRHISDSVATYTGDFIFGKRHGQGAMEYPTGDTYDGDWYEDQCHGQGTFVEKKTGNKYVGGYKDGKRHGRGISYWEVADQEMDLCQICYSEEQDALFYDCGHVCACVTCARQVDICPICRKNIISVVKIYRT